MKEISEYKLKIYSNSSVTNFSNKIEAMQSNLFIKSVNTGKQLAKIIWK